MRKALLTCFAVAVLAPAASAVPGTCVVLSDPAGDTRLLGEVPSDAMSGLDLVAVEATASASEVTVVFTTHGAPDPAPGVNYEYSFRFWDGGAEYDLNAGLDGGAHVPVTGVYELYTPDGRVTVSGSVDLAANQVMITAPASAFGVAAFAEGQSWTTGVVGTGHGAGGFRYYHSDRVAVPAGSALVVGDGACA